VNKTDDQNQTPLHLAAIGGHTEYVNRTLVKRPLAAVSILICLRCLIHHGAVLQDSDAAGEERQQVADARRVWEGAPTAIIFFYIRKYNICMFTSHIRQAIAK
jgi:ankyrin repeat protein